jgi:imidazolonepropionase
MRNRGASYQDIAAAGGGIHASAMRIADASIDQIVKESLPRFESSLSFGVTTIECKSGYGLTWKGEEKLLVALREIEKIVPQRMSKTFLIHVVPKEWQSKRKEFSKTIIDDMIPEVAERRLASCVDVFCEEGAFTVDESRSFLAAAKNEGMEVTVHANQFGHSGGALLAAELGARSADHLEYLNDEEIGELSNAGVTGVALPACVFFMGTIPYPPMRKMIDSGMRLAIATDLNPGTAMTESIPFCMTAASIYGKLSFAELLWSVTFDAARVIKCEEKVGSLESGKAADFTIWDHTNPESIAYFLAGTKPDEVWISGEQIVKSDENTKRY